MSARIDIPVAGGELAVYRLGSERSEAPAVLAVHGITSTGFAWLPVAAALAGDVSVIAVDLRGRGQSGSLPGPFGLDTHVEDLVAVLDTLALQRPVVLGHSMGSYVAARLAAIPTASRAWCWSTAG
jgi:pimeloyl-ACP methyl ester carboxylesterase